MEHKMFNPDDNFAKNMVVDIEQRLQEVLANNEECHHCKNKARGLTVIRAMVIKGGEKTIHLTTIAVCKNHGKQNKKTDKKNHRIALDTVRDYYGTFEGVEFTKV